MKYRSEVDGLRALAVLPVIFFHAHMAWFSGGFMGVDIFFVISGYLIGSILLQECAAGDFSIRRFYARRARRILPPLFFIMLVMIPFAFAWMLPSQYESFAGSAVAVVLFLSNIFFWNESGYFVREAAEKPLLHTWSLGVEEQFYLLFPLALLLLWRFGRHRVFYIMAAGALLSLAASEYASRYYLNVNFFFLPTRAWELLAGVLCAFAPRHSHARGNNFLSIAGLALIAVALLTYDEQMRLPSLYTMVPVAGTALVILYGTGGSWAARVLSWRPLVGIGLISYSAYLWHQPLFALARIRSFNLTFETTMLILIPTSLLLAALTWRFIEQPFRDKNHPRYVQNKPALRMAGAAAVLLMAIGLAGTLTHGHLAYWKRHTPPTHVRAFELIEAADKAQLSHFYDNGDCIFRVDNVSEKTANRLISCHKKYGKGVAIIGDSHAINLFFVLKVHAEHYPFIAGISQTACRPHTPLATCYYDDLLRLLEHHPNLFHDIIYEQAGWHLLTDTRGREITNDGLIKDVPLTAAMPNFAPNTAFMDSVIAYLTQLTPYSRVTWFGPRMEPKIRSSVIIRHGCDHTFSLRPNQAQLYQNLDAAVRARVEPSAIAYRSQIEMVQLDMTRDFISCDATYFADGNHYSEVGEPYFGNRITLQKLIGR